VLSGLFAVDYDLALLDGMVFRNGKLAKANVYVKGKKIALVSKQKKKAKKEVDCKGKWILPGMVDSHVHFREPGMSNKAEWGTESKAAAAGGVTTVLDMPNNKPPTTSVKELEKKKKNAAKNSAVNYGFHFGATSDNAGEVRKATGITSLKVFMGSSTGNLLMTKEEDLRNAFSLAKKKKVPVTIHAEDEDVIAFYTDFVRKKGRKDALAHCDARPPLAAEEAVWRAVSLSGEIGNRIHLLHVSTNAELGIIRDAKKRGVKVTCEATPHHLFFNKSEMKKQGNRVKMNPPLRSEEDRRALFKALKSGLVDTVGTDHAPHTKDEKKGSVWKAPSGVPGVQTALPLLLDAVSKKKLSLKRLVQAFSEKPAEVFGLKKKAKIAKGYDADLIVVDPKKKWKIMDKGMLYKCGWTPFKGKTVTGKVEATIVNGKIAYSG